MATPPSAGHGLNAYLWDASSGVMESVLAQGRFSGSEPFFDLECGTPDVPFTGKTTLSASVSKTSATLTMFGRSNTVPAIAVVTLNNAKVASVTITQADADMNPVGAPLLQWVNKQFPSGYVYLW